MFKISMKTFLLIIPRWMAQNSKLRGEKHLKLLSFIQEFEKSANTRGGGDTPTKKSKYKNNQTSICVSGMTFRFIDRRIGCRSPLRRRPFSPLQLIPQSDQPEDFPRKRLALKPAASFSRDLSSRARELRASRLSPLKRRGVFVMLFLWTFAKLQRAAGRNPSDTSALIAAANAAISKVYIKIHSLSMRLP